MTRPATFLVEDRFASLRIARRHTGIRGSRQRANVGDDLAHLAVIEEGSWHRGPRDTVTDVLNQVSIRVPVIEDSGCKARRNAAFSLHAVTARAMRAEHLCSGRDIFRIVSAILRCPTLSEDHCTTNEANRHPSHGVLYRGVYRKFAVPYGRLCLY